MFTGPVHIQVNNGREGDPRLPFLINRGRVLLGPLVEYADVRGGFGVQEDTYHLEDGSYVRVIASPYVRTISVNIQVDRGEEGERRRFRDDRRPLVFAAADYAYYDSAYGSAFMGGQPVRSFAPSYQSSVEPSQLPNWETWKGGTESATPVGQINWIHYTQDPLLPPEPVHAVSWEGPSHRYFAHTPDGLNPGRYVRVNSYDDKVPGQRIGTPFDVYGAFIKDGTLYAVEFSALQQLVFHRKVPASEEFPTGWALTATAAPPVSLTRLGSHVFADRFASECRCVAVEVPGAGTTYGQTGDDAEGQPLNVELIVNLHTYEVTLGYRNLDNPPRYEATIADKMNTAVGVDRYKLYGLTEAQSYSGAGNTFSIRVSYRTSDGLNVNRRCQLPYPGETYLLKSGEDTASFVVDAVSVEGGLTEDTGPSQPHNLATDIYRGDFYGTYGVLTCTWLGSNFDNSVTFSVGAEVSYVNGTGEVKYLWHRKKVTKSAGKSIVAVDFDSSGQVVKAFLEPDQRCTEYNYVGFGPGLPHLVDPSVHPWARFRDFISGSRYAADPYDPTSEELVFPDFVPGAVHNGYMTMETFNQVKGYLVIQGGQSDGRKYLLVDCAAYMLESRYSSGYTPTDTGNFYPGNISLFDYNVPVGSFDKYERDIVVSLMDENPTADHPPEGDSLAGMGYVHVNAVPECTVNYLDLRWGVLSTTTVTDSNLRHTEFENYGGFYEGTVNTKEVADWGVFTNNDPPDYTGGDKLTGIGGGYRRKPRVRRWFVEAHKLFTYNTAENDRHTSLRSGYINDACDGIPPVAARFNTRGRKYDGDALRDGGMVLCTPMHESQSSKFNPLVGEKAAPSKREYTRFPWSIFTLNVQPFYNGTVDLRLHGSNNFYAAFSTGFAAVDHKGTVVACGWTRDKYEDAFLWGSSYGYIFGDSQDLLYVYDLAGGPYESESAWMELTGLFYVELDLAYPYSSEIRYGAKVTLKGAEYEEDA